MGHGLSAISFTADPLPGASAGTGKTAKIVFAAALCLLCAAFWCVPSHAASSDFSQPLASSEFAPGDDPALQQKAGEAARRAERSLSLQTEIPAGSQRIRRENVPEANISNPLTISQRTAQAILYIAIGIILVIVLMSLKDNLWSSSRSRRLSHEEEGEIAPAATAVRMEKAQAEADVLASGGSFAEAMHVLLLQSVNELRRMLDISIAASLTSREILYRVALPSEGRNAFADVIRWVEISYFGFHEPTREDYAACRQSYEILAAVLRRGRAA